MLTDIDKEFDTPIEDDNGELIEVIEEDDIFVEEDTGLEEQPDSFYEVEDDIVQEGEDEEELDNIQEVTVEAKENYENAKEQLVAIFTSILEAGEITAEDNANIEEVKEQYSEAYDDIKENTEVIQKKTLEEKIEELKDGMVGSNPDEILNILTDDGRKPWLYKNEDNDVLVDMTAIPELTVLINKLFLIATDGENEGEFQLTPDFIKMIVGGTGSGNAIDKIINKYYLSTSKVELVGGAWGDVLPTPVEQEGKFLWIKTVTTFLDKDKLPQETTPICVSAQDGSKGKDGLNGADGVDGKDGVSLTYKGEFTAHPSNPQNGWYYRNTTEGKTFVYQDNNWYQMTVDGQDGLNGNNGKDGLSIEYKGELSSPPSNPVKNWTYKDSDNGVVYIYTGLAWKVMTYDGSNGQDGANGSNGLSVFITYNDSATQPTTPTGNGTTGGWHTTCTASSVWISQKISDNASSGTWGTPLKIKGTDGITYYTWIKYANDSAGNGLSDDPTGKLYIGFAYNKTTPIESTTPSDYTWSLIKGDKGDTGAKGATGANGITYYTWIKYSDNATGNPCYDTPTSSTQYIGIAINKTTSTESTDYTQYVWSKFKGDTGVKGDTGASVEEIIIQYSKNQSTTTPPADGWGTSMPSYQEGYFLWIRTRIKYSNNANYIYSTATCDQSWKANAEVYTQYKQLKEKFSWLVKSGDSESNMELTDALFKVLAETISLTAKNINLNGYISNDGGNFELDQQGNMEVQDLSVKGEFYCKNLAITTFDNPKYPEALDGSININIDAINGNDDRGLDDGAIFASLSGALSKIPKNLGGKTINISLSTDLTEDISIDWFYCGRIRVFFQGNKLCGVYKTYRCHAMLNTFGGSVENPTGAIGYIMPYKGYAHSGVSSSSPNLGSIDTAMYNMKIYAATNLASGCSESVANSCSDNGYTYVDNITTINCNHGFRSTANGLIYSNSSGGKATRYGFVAVSGGQIRLSNGQHTGGAADNTYESSGGEVKKHGATFVGTAESGSNTSTPTVTTKKVAYTSAYGDAYRTTWSSWRDKGQVVQSEGYGAGKNKGYWFFGSQFAEIKGCAEVNQVVLRVKRLKIGGWGSPLSLKLAYHNYSSKPSTPSSSSPTYFQSVTIPAYSDTSDNYTNITITNPTILEGIKNGSIKGFGLYDSNYASNTYGGCSGTAKATITYKE